MTDTKKIKQLIKHNMSLYAKEKGFKFQNPTLLYKLNGNFVQILDFTVQPKHFYCNYALQPLYVPATTFVLSCGSRVRKQGKDLWDIGDSEISLEQSVTELKKNLDAEISPWFEEKGSMEGLVSFIEGSEITDSKFVGFPPHLRYIYLGFSYLSLEQYDKAKLTLENVLQFFQGDSRPWVQDTCALVRTMLELAKNEPSSLKVKLSEIINQNKVQLKLKV
ncbi:hypothetical protein [Paenibacillus sp. Soil787]|uniref:hypothetical protein n=1 Tax=Paenibacillus sp. Soil787 TaxID=1736411 RepID=UPI00070250F0|nr:hypothetical protein [Paenibacillus sp. Soil787]KRF27652.1 hypothetical protein ASG93_29355 [Paenibacillus sp. Soil787]